MGWFILGFILGMFVFKRMEITISYKNKRDDITQELNNLANNMAKDGLVGYADNIRDIMNL